MGRKQREFDKNAPKQRVHCCVIWLDTKTQVVLDIKTYFVVGHKDIIGFRQKDIFCWT